MFGRIGLPMQVFSILVQTFFVQLNAFTIIPQTVRDPLSNKRIGSTARSDEPRDTSGALVAV